MKRLSALVALFALMTVALAVPAFAGEKCQAADAQACLGQMAAMKDKGWIGLDLDKTDMTSVKVKSIIPGSPASKAGFAVGDIIVAINGASLTDKEALMKAKGDWAIGQSVSYTIKRKDAERTLTAKLDRMPEDVFAQMIGKHMLEAHMTMAAATTPAPATTTPATTPVSTTTTEKTNK
jgi:predicted metalloprotease with PDZ domain